MIKRYNYPDSFLNLGSRKRAITRDSPTPVWAEQWVTPALYPVEKYVLPVEFTDLRDAALWLKDSDWLCPEFHFGERIWFDDNGLPRSVKNLLSRTKTGCYKRHQRSVAYNKKRRTNHRNREKTPYEKQMQKVDKLTDQLLIEAEELNRLAPAYHAIMKKEWELDGI